MFGIGSAELVVILIIAFLVFGPTKLPEIARKLGTAVREFRKAMEQLNEPPKK